MLRGASSVPAPAHPGPDPVQGPSWVDAGTCVQLCSLGLPKQAGAVLSSPPSPFSCSPFPNRELCWDGCQEQPGPCSARACAWSGTQHLLARGGKNLKDARGASQAVD